MFIAVNCLPISSGKTGIGAYAADLVESLSRYPGGHRYALICGQGQALWPDLDTEAFSLVPVEVRDWTWCQLQLPALLEETAAAAKCGVRNAERGVERPRRTAERPKTGDRRPETNGQGTGTALGEPKVKGSNSQRVEGPRGGRVEGVG